MKLLTYKIELVHITQTQKEYNQSLFFLYSSPKVKNMIKVTKLNQYGKPIMAECPEHGEVKIINMPSEGTGSLKRINRAKASGGKVNYGNSPKKGTLSCGCTFTSNEVNDELQRQFNYVCRLIELANDICFGKTDENHDDFKQRMFEVFNGYMVKRPYGNEIKFDKEFDGTEYQMIINEFEGIEKYLSNLSSYYKISDDNIIAKYYYQPPKQEMPSEYTWDAVFTVKLDGSKEVADYLVDWCKHNDIELDLKGNETSEEIAEYCVKMMYS